MAKLKQLITVGLLLLLWACSAQNPISKQEVSEQPVTKQSTTSKSLGDLAGLETDYSAHWLTPDILLSKQAAKRAKLISSSSGRIDDTSEFDQQFELSPIATPEWVAQQYPHLAEFSAYQVIVPSDKLHSLLKDQLAMVSLDDSGSPVHLAYLQTANLLDQLFTAGADDADEFAEFGAVIKSDLTQFSLWAPTARSVKVRLFNQDKAPIESGIVNLTLNKKTGIWQGLTSHAPQGTYYLYQVQLYHPASKSIETLRVTDPYSHSLSTNSAYSQVVDLASAQTQPSDWHNQLIAELKSPEELVLYELHIRDFSANDNSLSEPTAAGKYAAFSENSSDGIMHLKALRKAGLNTIHLLPTFDLSTINEQPNEVILLSEKINIICSKLPQFSLCPEPQWANQTLATYLSSLDPLSADAQAVVEQIRTLDAYNWGYDPFHFSVPEGSYANDPDGIARIIEFRTMIQRLHELGFRVVMDVVYNHTYAAGLNNKSVFDKIVPNYYYRLNPVSGSIERSTCCENTATEQAMMAKLMTDSLVMWAKHYKIDGFRFDLMGHQPKSVMLAAREAVRQVDLDTYFYGEGWNFGEVANNTRFIQATQAEMAGSEIGTYTDRLRDAVRGGSSFVSGDEIRIGQGIGNGLLFIPNELHTEQNQQASLDEFMLSMDQIRVGLTGNLADYFLQNAQGEWVKGKDINYGGAPTGYALDPADTINYVSKHDNQTLWDNNQYRIANEVSTEDRVRMQILSLGFPIMAQGIPFIHMGSELLRSKSFLRDSYDFGDWFNKVDFSKQSNNYHVGLPPAEKDQANWDVIKRLLSNNEGRDEVTSEHIQHASDVFMDLLSIRTGSPLFSLNSAEQIIRQLYFNNTGPQQQKGLIVMGIDDPNDLDPKVEQIMVIFNTTAQTQMFAYPDAKSYHLHPIQQQGADPIVKNAKANDTGFTVPALTLAIFIQ